MNLHGLFRCQVKHDPDLFNFFLMKLARNSEQQLVWELVDDFRNCNKDWRLDDAPLIRDLSEDEGNQSENEPLLFYQSDLEAFK